MPRVARMVRHAKLEARLTHQRRPCANNVALWSNARAVPAVMFALKQIQIVVMAGHGEEIAGTCLLISAQQILRLPLLRFPPSNYVDESGPAGVTIVADVMIVCRLPLHVHQPP